MAALAAGAALLVWAAAGGLGSLAVGIAAGGGCVALAVFALRLSTRVRRLQGELAACEAKLAVAPRDAASVQFNDADLPDKTAILEAALNHMSLGFAMILPDGKIWAYNRKAVEFAGIDESKLVYPATAREVFLAQLEAGELGEKGALLPEDVRDFFMKGVGRLPAAYARRRPDGTVIEIRSGPLPGGGTVQSYADITDLVRAKETAEAAMQEKSAFLATMSHEIRTPLNGVIGMAELLGNSELSTSQSSNLRILAECADALLCIINDVLDFSKLESGKLQLERVPIDLREVCGSAIDITRPIAQPKNLSFAWTIEPGLPVLVLGDAPRLRQVLLNLIGNALKFTENGSVRLHVSPSGAGRARFEVVDTGIGIPVEARGRIFKDFSQVDSSIGRRFGGTGLGLAICKRLVEAMGGEIGFESEEGVGSRFWFEVPVPGATEAAASMQSHISGNARALDVLLVDDGRVNRIVGSQMLNLLGHHVDVAEDGAESVAKVAARSYDLVLMDMQMPGMDGLAATRAIRALAAPNNEVPIVALTANESVGDREACRAAGMDGFLSKPFKSTQLAEAIERAIKRRPDRTELLDKARLEVLAEHLGEDRLGELLAVSEAEVTELLKALQSTGSAYPDALARLVRSLEISLAAIGLSGAAARCKSAAREPTLAEGEELRDAARAGFGAARKSLTGKTAVRGVE